MTAPSGALRADMSSVLTQQPMISMTALYMRHEEIGAGGPADVAATDGSRVMIWPAFRGYADPERRAILLHEYLHAAFAHPLRAARLRMRLGAAFRMDVLNVGADAIINEGIRRIGVGGRLAAFTLPKGAIDLSDLAAKARSIVALTGVDVDVERMKQVEKLTLEWMYDALMRLLAAAEELQRPDGCGESTGDPQDKDGTSEDAEGKPSEGAPQTSGSGTGSPGPEETRMRDDAKAFADMMRRPSDIRIDDLRGMTREEIEDGIREAGERIRGAAAMGKGHGGGRADVLEVLAGDIPVARTPWESSFRSLTQRHLARQRTRRPGLPGGRVLTQEAMGLDSVVWSPARRRPRVPLVVVVLDSSGSITPGEYLRYLGEIQAMKRRTNARIVAMVADTRVHSVTDVENVSDLADVEFRGRGGTDFRDAIELAETLDPDLLVYLTDLAGTFPDRKPSFPVIWALTAADVPQHYSPPFGSVIHVG